MSKTARELLEESVTYFVHPIAEIDGEVITGWGRDGELVRVAIPTNAKILDKNALWDEPADVVRLMGSRGMAVCAIGALSLASLGMNLGVKEGDYRNWSTQVEVDPEVAYATLALAWTLLMKDPHRYAMMMRNRATSGNSADNKWFYDFVLGLPTINNWTDKEKSRRARCLVDCVTQYNDEETRILSEMVDLFNSTIKNLIEAEGAVV